MIAEDAVAIAGARGTSHTLDVRSACTDVGLVGNPFVQVRVGVIDATARAITRDCGRRGRRRVWGAVRVHDGTGR